LELDGLATMRGRCNYAWEPATKPTFPRSAPETLAGSRRPFLATLQALLDSPQDAQSLVSPVSYARGRTAHCASPDCKELLLLLLSASHLKRFIRPSAHSHTAQLGLRTLVKLLASSPRPNTVRRAPATAPGIHWPQQYCASDTAIKYFARRNAIICFPLPDLKIIFFDSPLPIRIPCHLHTLTWPKDGVNIGTATSYICYYSNASRSAFLV
jgi:hypothetical protein